MDCVAIQEVPSRTQVASLRLPSDEKLQERIRLTSGSQPIRW